MLTAIRSFLYNIYFYGFTTFILLISLVVLPFPRSVMRVWVRVWVIGLIWGLKVIAGVGYQVRGRENLKSLLDQKEGVIFACKHQSAWETFIFYLLVDEPFYVLKQELLNIPIWGWCASKAGSIAVNRQGGASALKDMVRKSKEALDAGYSLVIFPEGTRTTPGKRYPYHPGVAAVYTQTKTRVIPVALNSGIFWGRHQFKKQPGLITLEFLPAIEPGLPRKEFLPLLQETIDQATNRLVDEACETYHLPKPVGETAEKEQRKENESEDQGL